MPKAIPAPVQRLIFSPLEEEGCAAAVAEELGVSVRSVRRWYRNFHEHGDATVAPAYDACGQNQPRRTP
jgi:hypothetical protein